MFFRRKERFGPLLLEEGEYFLEDFSATYFPPPSASGARQASHRGRLKLCTRSLYFDPEDTRLPVTRLPLRNTSEIDAPSVLSGSGPAGGFDSAAVKRGALLTGEHASAYGGARVLLRLRTSRVAEMRPGGEDVPYAFRDTPADHRFSLEFGDEVRVAQQAEELRGWAALGPSEQAKRVDAAIRERAAAMVFDASWLEDLTERRVSEHACESVGPLVSEPGRVLLTTQRLYFQPLNPASSSPVFKYKLASMESVHKRRHVLRHTGLEVIMAEGSSAFFALPTTDERDALFDSLLGQDAAPSSLRSPDPGNVTLRWQNGLISNFDYLMHLNHLADRTFNDIAQYPVFPWVICDYSSRSLDLGDPRVYRDLSKPVGALNPARLDQFRARFREMPEPRFLYGTHYSTPGYVVSYLVRQRPELMLKLQSGKFDAPDRLFHSLPATWDSVYSNPGDVKELIPEFYMPPGDFLVNVDNLKLGVTQSGKKVDDVDLPPWARDPRDLTTKLREALESDHVSANLHHWIDLIFGHKQRGEESVKADNVFYHLTYEGAVDLEAQSDPDVRAGLEAQIREFGQTPKQLFSTPHPQRVPASERKSAGQLQSQLAPSAGSSNSTSNPARVNQSRGSFGGDGSGHGGSFSSSSFSSSASSSAPSHSSSSSSSSVSASSASASSSSSSSSPGSVPGGTSVPAGSRPGAGADANKSGSPGTGDSDDDDGIASGVPKRPWASAPFDGHANHASHRLHRDKVVAMCPSSSKGDNVVITASADTTMRIFSVDTGKQQRSVSMGQLALSSCAVSPDGKTVVAGSWDNAVYLYSVEFGRILDNMHAHDDAVGCLCRRGPVLITGGWDATLKVWRCGEGAPERAPHAELLEHETEVTCVDAVVSSDESGPRIAASGSQDGMVVVWCLKTFRALKTIHADTDAITGIRLSRDGKRVYTSSLSGCLKIHEATGAQVWATDTGAPLHCIDTDGVYAIVGGDAGTVSVYRVADGFRAHILKPKGPVSPIHSIAVVGEKVVAGCGDGQIRVWSTEA